ADAVIKIEDTTIDGNDVLIFTPAKVGQHVRYAGEDVAQGAMVIPAGKQLGAAQVGMLARLGTEQVLVFQRPRIAIITTGNEIIGVGKPLGPGQIYDCNQYTLFGQCLNAGAIPSCVIRVNDDVEPIMAAIHSAGETSDAIITSGGVSMGKYDHMKTALKRFADMAFWEVAIKPGKPFAYGHIAGIPLFALPGNPVSSMVTFDLFARPALQHMVGMSPDVEIVSARTPVLIKHTPGRTEFVRATTHWHEDGYVAIPTGDQSSGRLSSMLEANSYIIIPENIETILPDEQVQVRFIQ
ncbi:MAG TPA: gephyrin-like molybdotransferase Glp, partial [Armatimonadota bacterium]|nr:gephyrin-like molybdotransferase Glp [Armatimonadota bacterium]